MGLPSLLLTPGGAKRRGDGGGGSDSFDEMQNNLTSSPDNPSGAHVSCEITLCTRSEAA